MKLQKKDMNYYLEEWNKRVLCVVFYFSVPKKIQESESVWQNKKNTGSLQKRDILVVPTNRQADGQSLVPTDTWMDGHFKTYEQWLQDGFVTIIWKLRS